MKNRIVFSTIDDPEAAKRIAEQLVLERAAACVNIIPNVSSVYKWKDKIESASELLLIIKTAGDRLEDLLKRIKELHPYDVPEIVAFPIEAGHQPYLDWIVAETRGEK